MIVVAVMIISFIVGMLVGGLIAIVLMLEYCQKYKK